MEKYPSYDTSTQYFKPILILNTQYDYEMIGGDQEKLARKN